MPLVRREGHIELGKFSLLPVLESGLALVRAQPNERP